MLRVLLAILTVLYAFAVNSLHISGLTTDGIPTMFPGQDSSPVSEVSSLTQYSQSLKINVTLDDLLDNNEAALSRGPHVAATSSLNIDDKNSGLFFWISSPAVGDSMIELTGSYEFLLTSTDEAFDHDAGPNNRTTNTNKSSTEPTWYISDSEQDDRQLDDMSQLISKKMADNLSFTFLYILEPLVAVTGCVCNIFNIIVLRKQGLGESTTCYLFALTLADLFYLMSALLYCIFIILKDGSYAAYVEWASGMRYDVLDRFCVIFTGRVSNFLVMVLSIERFIAVRFPLSIKLTPLSRHPKKIITGVCLFVSALLIPNILRTKFAIVQDPVTNNTIATYTFTEFQKANKEFYIYYTYFILVSLRLLPVLIVLILNLGIIVVLKGSNRIVGHMNAVGTKRQSKQVKITRMLIAIAVIFLVCVSPGLVHSLLTVFYRPYYVDNPNLWEAFQVAFPIFDIVNSTVNFIVYIMMSDKFRRLFFEIVCPKHNNLKQESSEKRGQADETLNTSI